MTTRYTAEDLLGLANLLLDVKAGLDADLRAGPDTSHHIQDAQDHVELATEAIKRAAKVRAGEELISQWEAQHQ